MSLTRPANEFAALIVKLRDFIDSEVIPREDLKNAHDGASEVHRAAIARRAFRHRLRP